MKLRKGDLLLYSGVGILSRMIRFVEDVVVESIVPGDLWNGVENGRCTKL